jgi:hypothetical protein
MGPLREREIRRPYRREMYSCGWTHYSARFLSLDRWQTAFRKKTLAGSRICSLSRPKFSPSQEIALLFIVEFRAR